MTRLTLARIVAEELATVREFEKGSAVRGRPRRTEWSERLPGFGIRFYNTGRSIYIVQALMNGVTRTVTMGSTKVLTKQEALKVARRVLLRAQVGEDPASEGTVRISVCGRAVKHYAAMALMKRSPKMTANWALAMDHSRGGIFHSFSDRFKIR
jgi:hypothetical protein